MMIGGELLEVCGLLRGKKLFKIYKYCEGSLKNRGKLRYERSNWHKSTQAKCQYTYYLNLGVVEVQRCIR